MGPPGLRFGYDRRAESIRGWRRGRGRGVEPRPGAPAMPAAIVLALLAVLPAIDEADATEPPPYDQFLVIPLRVHILKADDLAEVDCKLADADIERVVGKVNGIWHNAGIHWGLESIVREAAAGQDRFRLVRDLEGEGK